MLLMLHIQKVDVPLDIQICLLYCCHVQNNVAALQDLAFSIVVNEFMRDGGLTARLADHQHISMGVCVFWHSWLNVCLFWSSWQ